MFNFNSNHCFVNQISGVPIFKEPQNSGLSLIQIEKETKNEFATKVVRTIENCSTNFGDKRFSVWIFNAVMLGWIETYMGTINIETKQTKKKWTKLNCQRTIYFQNDNKENKSCFSKPKIVGFVILAHLPCGNEIVFWIKFEQNAIWSHARITIHSILYYVCVCVWVCVCQQNNFTDDREVERARKREFFYFFIRLQLIGWDRNIENGYELRLEIKWLPTSDFPTMENE